MFFSTGMFRQDTYRRFLSKNFNKLNASHTKITSEAGKGTDMTLY